MAQVARAFVGGKSLCASLQRGAQGFSFMRRHPYLRSASRELVATTVPYLQAYLLAKLVRFARQQCELKSQRGSHRPQILATVRKMGVDGRFLMSLNQWKMRLNRGERIRTSDLLRPRQAR